MCICKKLEEKDVNMISLPGNEVDREEKRGKSEGMARKGNPISVRLDQNRSSDSSWFRELRFFIYFLLLKRSFRFILSLTYMRFLISGGSLLGDASFFMDCWGWDAGIQAFRNQFIGDFLVKHVHSGSNESGNSAGETSLPALESSSSSESLATFRALIAGDNEAEIYQRIRALESQDFYNVPPQNQPGEYEGLVRQHFDQAISVPHFRWIYDVEYFELTVLERKGTLQDRLLNLMLSEPRIERIMEMSPYTSVRKEAYYFIHYKLGPVDSLRHPFQWHLMDGSLNAFLRDLNQSGRNAEIYREFYRHFTDEEFRRALGLPLP